MEKTELGRLRLLKNELKDIQRRRAELYSRAISTVGRLTASPGGGGISDKTALAAAIADYDAQLAECEYKIAVQLHELEAYIQSVPDPEVRLLMRLKYVDCLSWLGCVTRYNNITGEYHDKSWAWKKVSGYLRNH